MITLPERFHKDIQSKQIQINQFVIIEHPLLKLYLAKNKQTLKVFSNIDAISKWKGGDADENILGITVLPNSIILFFNLFNTAPLFFINQSISYV